MLESGINHGAATALAGEVDSVFLYILAVGLFFFVVTQGTLIYFALKYRRKRGEADRPTPDIRYNKQLEVLFVVIPSILVVSIFYYGYEVYVKMRTPMPGAQEIGVVAKKWLWEFTYPDGRKAVNELRVAVGQPVELNMTSEDVIHSLYIPDFRDKQDVLPGRYTKMWLKPEKTGEYVIFCAEYCGAGHSLMMANLIVMEPHEYDEWVARQKEESEAAVSPVEHGRKLVESSGCTACHGLDGEQKVGPSLRGIYGRKVELADGKTVTADEDYIKESLVDPGAKVVKGFPNVMPTFKATLTDADITDVIAYLKTLGKTGQEEKPEPAPPKTTEHAAEPDAETGERLAEARGCMACHSTDGSPGVGPSFKGLYGRNVKLTDGKTLRAEDAYIRESMLDPGAKVVEGFQPVMPPFKGSLTDADVADITAYIKTLK